MSSGGASFSKHVVAELVRKGWSVKKNKKHYRLFPPDKNIPMLVMSASPSDFRAIKKIRADIRNRGEDIPIF